MTKGLLHNHCCPECGGTRLAVGVEAWARLIPANGHDIVDVSDFDLLEVSGDWNSNSNARCLDCTWAGDVRNCETATQEKRRQQADRVDKFSDNLKNLFDV